MGRCFCLNRPADGRTTQEQAVGAAPSRKCRRWPEDGGSVRERNSTEDGAWTAAVDRASAAASSLGTVDERCWDHVAVRDTIAFVLYALHLADDTPVDDVPWRSVLWHLLDDQRVIALMEDVLPAAGSPLHGDGPVARRWQWLNRTWDPQASVHTGAVQPGALAGSNGPAAEPRWGGMTRGIAAGLPDPAIEIAVAGAGSAVEAALGTEHRALARHDRVRVRGGPHAGMGGYVRELGWTTDDAAMQVLDGPSAGYVVELDEVPGTIRIAAEDLAIGDDGLRWARRWNTQGQAPTRADRPHAASAVVRAAPCRRPGPGSQPRHRAPGTTGRGRGRARGPHRADPARRHPPPEPVDLDGVPAPVPAHPRRRHRDGPVAQVWEVAFTRHVADTDEEVHLALAEDDVAAPVERRTATPNPGRHA